MKIRVYYENRRNEKKREAESPWKVRYHAGLKRII